MSPFVVRVVVPPSGPVAPVAPVGPVGPVVAEATMVTVAPTATPSDVLARVRVIAVVVIVE